MVNPCQHHQKLLPVRGDFRHDNWSNRSSSTNPAAFEPTARTRSWAWRTLINIRAHIWNGTIANLEAEADHDQKQAEQKERLSARLADFWAITSNDIDRRAIDQRDAVDQEPRRQRADDEIFHARSKRLGRGAR